MRNPVTSDRILTLGYASQMIYTAWFVSFWIDGIVPTGWWWIAAWWTDAWTALAATRLIRRGYPTVVGPLTPHLLLGTVSSWLADRYLTPRRRRRHP